jgi:hypothetical protein
MAQQAPDRPRLGGDRDGRACAVAERLPGALPYAGAEISDLDPALQEPIDARGQGRDAVLPKPGRPSGEASVAS